MTNSFVESFWLGKELQTKDSSNDTARKEEIRATLNRWQSCLIPRVRRLLSFEEESNGLKELVLLDNSFINCEKGLLKENAFIRLRNGM